MDEVSIKDDEESMKMLVVECAVATIPIVADDVPSVNRPV